jgi:hypothetical protein
VRSRGSTVGQANTCLALFDLPCAPPPPHPNRLRLLIANIAGVYYVGNLLKSWFVQGFESMTGIEPGTALLLAFANTTKPLQRIMA